MLPADGSEDEVPPLLADAVDAVCAKAFDARVRETPREDAIPTAFLIRELLRQTEFILFIQLSVKF